MQKRQAKATKAERMIAAEDPSAVKSIRLAATDLSDAQARGQWTCLFAPKAGTAEEHTALHRHALRSSTDS